PKSPNLNPLDYFFWRHLKVASCEAIRKTPDIFGDGQKTLHEACDKSLIDIIQLLKVEIVIGIGNYAEKRAQLAVQTGGLPVQVIVLRHPSPRAVGNQNWKEIAKKRLNELGLLKYFDKASTAVV
ncbi:Single-strand selective monofunctional uracil DNA glycosylase, partial [Trachymyrmex septentrionalis]